MIERKILLNLITQTEFLRQIKSEWKPDYVESHTARLISMWCWEYFDKYAKAPVKDIELIYIQKLKAGLDKKLAKEIEEDILPGLSEEYERGEINVTYILEQTRNYFKERQITLHNEALTAMLSKNKIDEAIVEAQNFKIPVSKNEDEIDLSKPEVLLAVDSAFDTTYQNLIEFPGALGDFWNEQMVRGGLIGILAPEKRGKTFLLLEFMMRAYRQKRKVAFFQAGDMTKNQQLTRICIYLAKRSNLEKYCGVRYIPVQDCVKNQNDTCDRKIRECNFGIFNEDDFTIRTKTTFEKLKTAYEENPRYKPCHNCTEWVNSRWGTTWLKKEEIKNPLTAKVAKHYIDKFFIKAKRNIKLSTHVNGTLTISKIKSTLKKWRIEEDFVPDVILIDYGDLIVPELRGEFRHQQNEIWRQFRSISQEEDCLVIVPTQSDSSSYTKDRLLMDNFSEDKRKFGHVTAMYGLNQDVLGREKEIGLMRINKIVIREGDFHHTQEVTVLQRLEIGRPFLGSFY